MAATRDFGSSFFVKISRGKKGRRHEQEEAASRDRDGNRPRTLPSFPYGVGRGPRTPGGESLASGYAGAIRHQLILLFRSTKGDPHGWQSNTTDKDGMRIASLLGRKIRGIALPSVGLTPMWRRTRSDFEQRQFEQEQTEETETPAFVSLLSSLAPVQSVHE